MTRVVLVEKDKKFLQSWKYNGSGLVSSINIYRCMWCDEFTGNNIPVIHNCDEFRMSHYGICKQCAKSLESFWKNDALETYYYEI